MRSFRESFDPGLGQLRAALAAMAAVLSSYGFALGLTHLAGLHVDIVVLAVALAVTLERTQRTRRPGELPVSFVLLPASAALASEIGREMIRHATVGDALFVVAVSATIWIRRFGPRPARVGTLATVVLVAILITPVNPYDGPAYSLWSALVAAFALAAITVAQLIASNVGHMTPALRAHPLRPQPPPPNERSRPPSQRPRMLEASTRMAVQMAAGLAAAFALGRALFPTHWTWIVLTAYIVASANRGRGDVVYKAGLRVTGAAAGTLLATLLAGAFAPGDAGAVVAIFVILGLVVWLRGINYAYWAAGITAALALLYGYFGQSSSTLLTQRLLQIVLGALLAILCAWLILPIKTIDVLRKRRYQAIIALNEFLTAAQTDPQDLSRQRHDVHRTLDQVDEIASPLLALRRLTRHWRPDPRAADSIDTLTRCRTIIDTITQLTDGPKQPDAPSRVQANTDALAQQITRLRRQAHGESA